MMHCKFAIFCLGIGIAIYAVTAQREKTFQQKTKGYPWPLPKSFNSDPTKQCIVSDKLTFNFGTLAKCDLMTAAQERAIRYMFGKKPAQAAGVLTAPTLTSIGILLNPAAGKSSNAECQSNQYPSIDMDESYQIQVTCGKTAMAVVSANSVWGLIRGIESLTQMTYLDDRSGTLVINQATVDDKPAYKWRGVMFDTSRHYLPMSLLLLNLEIMAANKMNVFHWHIVDDQSFPYVSKTFPQLSAAGAYSPRHIYTQDDVRTLVNKARLLGIRVVSEFDTPGHSKSWGSGMPQWLTECYDANNQKTGEYGPIDPSYPGIFQNLTALFQEILQVFPDQYLHLGGDEVSPNCWMSSSRIWEMRQSLKIKDMEDFFAYYVMQQEGFLDTLTKNQGRYIYWEDVVIYKKVPLPSDKAVVQVWRDLPTLSAITKTGLKAIYSSCWYTGYQSGPRDWARFYNCDPLSFSSNNDPKQVDLVIGGEAVTWGEYFDATNVLSRTWPAASAIAERLWSDPRSSFEKYPNSAVYKALEADSLPDTLLRIEEHRCRMIGRGFPAEPPLGPGFCDVEYQQ